MARPRTLPDTDELRVLLGRYKQTEIAAMYNVTRAAVSSAVQRYGLHTDYERYDDLIPWRVQGDRHQRHYALRMLRMHARRSRGKKLDDQDNRYLDTWLREMSDRGLVVDYDPDDADGFYYTAAREGVDTGLVRVPPWLLDEAPTARPPRARAR